MDGQANAPRVVRSGVFELDRRAGELRKNSLNRANNRLRATLVALGSAPVGRAAGEAE
jgi:hypothetical protein